MTPAELRVVREACGLSVAWLADRIGVANKTVNRYETGAIPISAKCRDTITEIDSDMAVLASAAVEDLRMFAPTERVYMVPRITGDNEMPAAYYRAIAALIRYELPDVVIEYDG